MAFSLKMAVPESSVDTLHPSKNLDNSKKDAKNKDKKVIVAAQEIKYAKCLAGNEKKTRDKALKSLTKWLHQRCVALPFTEADFMLLWKGLFYSMWMSDKPLVQEECAESIAKLIHSLAPKARMMFFKCGLRTLGNEWFGIDQLRLDKFLMLVRRMLRQGFVALKQQNWKPVKEFRQLLDDTILNNENKVPLGLSLHFTEIYLEELAKVSEGEFHSTVLIELLTPFTKQLATTNDSRQILCISKHIFKHLMRQSDSGLEYNEKFHAWKRLGFPGGDIDCLQQSNVPDDISDSDERMSDEEEEGGGDKPLDPRAGRVNVDLPQLRFSPKQLIALLTNYRFAPGSNTKSRKAINKLITEFTQMMNGRFPLGMRKVEVHKDNSTKLKQSVNRLERFEKKLMQDSNKRKASDDKPDGQPQPKKQKFDTKKAQKHKIVEVQTVKQKKKLKKDQKIKLNKIKKAKLDSDSDESIPAEEVYKNFDSAFQRNSGMWFVFNGDGSENGGNDGEKKEKQEGEDGENYGMMMEEYKSGDDDENCGEKEGVKRRKTKKPIKWNRDCSIQLVPESLKSPKRKTPKKSNGLSELDNSGKKLNVLDVNIFNGSAIKQESSPKKFNDTNESLQQKKMASPQKAKDLIGETNKSPLKTFETNKSSLKTFETNKSLLKTFETNKSPLKTFVTNKSPQKTVETNRSPQKTKSFPEKVKTLNKSLEKGGVSKSPKKLSESDESSPKKKNFNSPVVNYSDSSVRKNKHSPNSNTSNKFDAKSKSPITENGAIADTQLNFEPDGESTPKKNLFHQTEWDSPLKDGEMEFFVVSNKHKEKMSKLASKSNKNVPELIKSSLSKIKGKNHRLSLDPNLVRNPFSMYGTPKSGKKVKIDLRLNKSQEIHEHEATIKRSPAIPFDANRKPVKPLLKPNAVSSPIDPFYRRRLNL